MKYMEALFMEMLFKSQAWERFILGVLHQREEPQNKRKSLKGLMSFNARDCGGIDIV